MSYRRVGALIVVFVFMATATYLYFDITGLQNHAVYRWFDEKKLIRQAHTGHANAQYELALRLSASPQEDAQVLHWLTQAAKAKHVKAQLALLNKQPSQNFSSVLNALQRQSDRAADYQLARIYAADTEDAEKRTEAIALFKIAAEHGHSEAQYELARILSNLSEAPSGEALHWLQKAAASPHNTKAHLMLARHYHNLNSYSNYQDAEFSQLTSKWLKIAAAQGDAEAQYELGYLYRYHRHKYDYIDITQAYSLFEQAAEQGHASAEYELGKRYTNLGPEQDNKKAIYWYQRSAQQGNVKSQYQLGSMYFWGEQDIPKDQQLGITWLERAADQGHRQAMYVMGRAAYYGQGVPKDIHVAIRWLEASVAQENPDGLPDNSDAKMLLAIIKKKQP